ncbi:MAG: hypothetical protein F4118_10560, partial [Acidimicrobiaceae bacterium]|nr:hypothetical protein [Candidatus Poribacteria bacterium]MYI36851.1 hypothetical protein [Acidimicrobiaceae bacterium]
MAITVAELAAAIRVGTSTEETAQVTRLKAVGETIIENYADAAPDAIKDEALIRLAGFLYDAPNVAYANALTGSGAASLLLPYRTHRAGIVESSGGTVRAPSTQGVDVDEVNDLIDERVEDWAEQDNTDPIPASKLANAPTGTVDNRARAAAATAQEAADQAQADAAANTQGLTNAGNDIAQLKSLTRDLEIDEVDEWNDVSDPAEMALTFITGSSVTLTQAQAASYGVSVRNPNGTDFWGAGSWIGRLPVTAVADKQKYRVQVKHTGYPDLYITGNTWELMEAGDGEAQGATYRYFLLPFFGETTANYSEEIPEILSQAHEVDHTNYTGLVAGKPAADIAATQAGSGLNQTQVDARVKAGVDDWAETGNTDPIP